jgi:hypothetical protein
VTGVTERARVSVVARDAVDAACAQGEQPERARSRCLLASDGDLDRAVAGRGFEQGDACAERVVVIQMTREVALGVADLLVALNGPVGI